MKVLQVRLHDATINVSFKLSRFIADWPSAPSKFISGIADRFRGWLPIGPRNFSVTPAFALEGLWCRCQLFGGACSIVLAPETLQLDFENVKQGTRPVILETVRRASGWLADALGDHGRDSLSFQTTAHLEALEADAADTYLAQFIPAETDELIRSEPNVKCLPSSRILLSGETEGWVLWRMFEKSLSIDNAVFVHTGIHVGSPDPMKFDDQVRLLDRAEKLAEAEARVRQRQIEFDAARSLRQKGFRAETKLAEAAAELDAAIARAAQISIDVDRTEIGAPFAGVIETRDAELGDFVEPGDIIARVMDEDPYLVVGQVSELDVGLLEEGDAGVARLADGETVEGKVRYIGGIAETATRTFRVELEIPNRARALRGGVTAEIRIPVESAQAHFLSPALLTLDDEGALGVRIVNGDAVVEFKPVSVFASEPDGVWVTGLPPVATVITVGQEFVRRGQTVRPIPERIERAS